MKFFVGKFRPSSLKPIWLFLFLIIASELQAQPPQLKRGNPVDHLPDYVKMVSGFGERPDWSPDGKKILFVGQPMGEVYELDLESGLIFPKTRHYNHYGYTRAMYLTNGDILLSGPIAPFDETDREDRERARNQSWLSVLDQSGNKEPVPLGIICAEGPAVSRHQLKIGWAERHLQNPDLDENTAQLFTAEIVYQQSKPTVKNRKLVFDSKELPFSLGRASLEAQSFVPPNDTQMTFSAYLIKEGNNTDTYLLNTETGEVKNLTNSPSYYDEPEGIFPDGKFTCVEHGWSVERPWPMIDIYKLKLDGSGEMQRLTFFSDYAGYKASQGVVSDDGNFLCFQIGKSGDEAGVGYGFFIMDLREAEQHLPAFKSYSGE
jgi:hypothetical protein